MGLYHGRANAIRPFLTITFFFSLTMHQTGHPSIIINLRIRLKYEGKMTIVPQIGKWACIMGGRMQFAPTKGIIRCANLFNPEKSASKSVAINIV